MDKTTPPDALSQLRDIHLPKAISNWPLAPGWIVLALLLLGFTFWGILLARAHYQRQKAKREALALLTQLTNEPFTTDQQRSAAISMLLKRVALVYYPRQQVASLSGNAWLLFLNQTSHGLDFNPVAFELTQLPYQSQGKATDLPLLVTLSHRWIKQRRRPCLN